MLLDTIDLQTWVPSVVESFEERMHLRHQQVYLVTLAQLPFLTTDLAELERILMELLTNACKYTPIGELIIVSVYASDKGTQLSVSSCGVEISVEEQSRIFDAFYRTPNSDPWQHSATGLRLALVQKLVKRLGASMRVESGNGQTTFTVEFPNEGMEKSGSNFNSQECVVVLPMPLSIGSFSA